MFSMGYDKLTHTLLYPLKYPVRCAVIQELQNIRSEHPELYKMLMKW